MSSQLKNRLVGATVLVGMVAISWPFIFDQAPQYPVDTLSQIPDAPEFQRFEVTPAQKPDRVASKSRLAVQENRIVGLEEEKTKVAASGSESLASATAKSDGANRSKKADTVEPKSSAYQLVENTVPTAVMTTKKVDAAETKKLAQKTVKAVAPPKPNNKPKRKTVAKAVNLAKKSIKKPAQKKSTKLLSKQANLASNGPPVSWTIQIASFKEKANAVKLRDRLAGEGFSSYIKPNPGTNSKILRVFVGPELDKLRARSIQKNLELKLKMKTLLLRYSN